MTVQRKRKVIWVGGLLLVAGAAGAWWWLRPAPLSPPSVPADVQELEVRRALEAAREKVEAAPRDPAAWGNLGKVFWAHLLDSEADACFAEAGRLAPRDATWVYARGLIALKVEPEKGIQRFREALAGKIPSDLRAAMSLQLADALLESGELEEAEKLYREDQELAPGEPRSALGLGLIARARGDDAAAHKFLTLALRSPSARKRALVQLAVVARIRGEKQTADDCEKQAAALPSDPHWPDPVLDEVLLLQVGRRGLMRRVGMLEGQGRYGDAAKLYLNHLEKERTAQACVGAGINLARVGDFTQALALLREGIRLEPASAHGHHSLALVLYSEGKAREGSNAAQAKERFREAVESARQAVKLRSDYARAYLIWGLSLKHQGESAAAVEPLRKGVACAPEDHELHLALGEVLFEIGRHKDAETHLENARRLAPNDPRASDALKRLRDKKS